MRYTSRSPDDVIISNNNTTYISSAVARYRALKGSYDGILIITLIKTSTPYDCNATGLVCNFIFSKSLLLLDTFRFSAHMTVNDNDVTNHYFCSDNKKPYSVGI